MAARFRGDVSLILTLAVIFGIIVLLGEVVYWGIEMGR